MTRGSVLARLPLLPTTVVGSYPVPEWLERLKTDYFRGRMSRAQLTDVHEMAIKAALHDQELAGIDIVSDGELRRDNDIDYFLARIPGIEIIEPCQGFLLRLLRGGAQQAAAEPSGARCAGAGRRLRVHRGAYSSADQVLLHRAVLARAPDPRRTPTRTTATSCWRSRGSSIPRPARWRTAGLNYCRSTSRSWPVTRSTWPPRSRRSTSSPRAYRRHLGAACLLRQPVRPAAVARPLRLPVPGGPGRHGRPARARVRPQGLRGPAR